MALRFSYQLTGAGWSSAQLDSGDVTVSLSASYLSDALRHLVEAVALVAEGVSSSRCSWDEEPGEFRWLFTRDNQSVRIVILVFDELWGNEPDERGRVIFDEAVAVQELARGILRGADDVLAQMTVEQYREKWIEHDYPTDAVERLRTALNYSKIEILEWHEHVRRRPLMYFGSGPTDADLLIQVILDCTYWLEPTASAILVAFPDRTFEVHDDGRVLGDSLARDGVAYLMKVLGGLNVPQLDGRGALPAVSALCTFLVVEASDGLRRFRAEFRGGVLVDFVEVATSGHPGTVIRFQPNKFHVSAAEVDFAIIETALLIAKTRGWFKESMSKRLSFEDQRRTPA
jgi:hypothetical protein